jgi:predicted aspartyl protease
VITGVVNAYLEPTIQLAVLDPTGQSHDVGVVVDTAYNGAITLPPAQVTALRLTVLYERDVLLADGTMQKIDIYEATVLWTDSRVPSRWMSWTPSRSSARHSCKVMNSRSSSCPAGR